MYNTNLFLILSYSILYFLTKYLRNIKYDNVIYLLPIDNNRGHIITEGDVRIFKNNLNFTN
jgi:hypothetical protein